MINHIKTPENYIGKHIRTTHRTIEQIVSAVEFGIKISAMSDEKESPFIGYGERPREGL